MAKESNAKNTRRSYRTTTRLITVLSDGETWDETEGCNTHMIPSHWGHNEVEAFLRHLRSEQGTEVEIDNF